jgi:hypothetical protein
LLIESRFGNKQCGPDLSGTVQPSTPALEAFSLLYQTGKVFFFAGCGAKFEEVVPRANQTKFGFAALGTGLLHAFLRRAFQFSSSSAAASAQNSLQYSFPDSVLYATYWEPLGSRRKGLPQNSQFLGDSGGYFTPFVRMSITAKTKCGKKAGVLDFLRDARGSFRMG